jgi:hypothetical protein
MMLLGALLCLSLVQDSDTVTQLERDRQAAFVRNDVAQLERETADDYTTIAANGKLNDKPGMMANLRAQKTRVVSVKLTDLKGRVYGGGSVAIVTGRYDDVHVTDGVQSEAHALFTRIFVKTNGTWQAVAYQQTSIAQR